MAWSTSCMSSWGTSCSRGAVTLRGSRRREFRTREVWAWSKFGGSLGDRYGRSVACSAGTRRITSELGRTVTTSTAGGTSSPARGMYYTPAFARVGRLPDVYYTPAFARVGRLPDVYYTPRV